MERMLSENNIDEGYSSLHQNDKGRRLYSYIPALLTILIFSRKHTSFDNLTQSISNTMKNSEIKRALESVSRYLEEDEQIPIHKIVGVLEIVDTMKKLQNNSYRNNGIQASRAVDHQGKHIGIMDSLKEHANEADRNLLDAIQSAVITAEKIQKVVKEVKIKNGNAKSMDALPNEEETMPESI